MVLKEICHMVLCCCYVSLLLISFFFFFTLYQMILRYWTSASRFAWHGIIMELWSSRTDMDTSVRITTDKQIKKYCQLIHKMMQRVKFIIAPRLLSFSTAVSLQTAATPLLLMLFFFFYFCFHCLHSVRMEIPFSLQPSTLSRWSCKPILTHSNAQSLHYFSLCCICAV